MWKWVKFPKAIALLAFFLPWMTVSCSGTKLVSATGVGLALGHFTSDLPNSGNAPDGGHLSYWLIAAILAIAVGLIFTFRNRASALAVTATSAAAFVLILVGTSRFSKSAILAEAAKKGHQDKSGEFGEQAMAAMIRVDWHFGYWLALLALIAAGVMAWLAYSGRDRNVTDAVRGALKSQSGAGLACPTCGRSLAAGTRFCPDDGTPIG